MAKVILESWREGFEKVSLTKLQVNMLGKSLNKKICQQRRQRKLINRMILLQKSMRYLLLGTSLFYVLLYLFILKSERINIEDLVLIRNISISVLIVALITSFFFIKKETSNLLILYQIIGISLILFFITSIFVFKVGELFFWDVKREEHNQFFEFSFSLLGWNYLLAIPYLILLIFECSVLFSKTRGTVSSK